MISTPLAVALKNTKHFFGPPHPDSKLALYRDTYYLLWKILKFLRKGKI